MNFRVSGLGSGMDIDNMMEQLMKVERQPVDRLMQQRQALEWKQEDYRELNTNLLSFRQKVFDMNLSSTYIQRSANSSNSNVTTATISDDSADGSYNIQVSQLASKSYAQSENTVGLKDENLSTKKLNELFNEGDFTDFSITIDGKSVEFVFDPVGDLGENQIAINTETDTFNGLLDKINGSDLDINIFHDNSTDKIYMNSILEGENQTIDISENSFLTDTLNINPEQIKSGSDAVLTVNGFDLTSTTNTVEFMDITFDLNQTGNATIEISQDVDEVFDKIKGFVEEYNELITNMNAKLLEERDRDYQPLTDEQKEHMSEREIELWEERARSGLLRNDRILMTTLSRMRTSFASRVESSDFGDLSQIGIKSGNYLERGILHIDENELRSAIEEDPEGVYRLFRGEGDEKGVAENLMDNVDSAISQIGDRAGRETALHDQSFLANRIREIDDRVERYEDRLARREESYWRQFTAMEKALDAMYNQGEWLNQQLASLSN